MIRLHPIPEHYHSCPYDGSALEACGWYMPGMRTLADLVCPTCGGAFYGDLPSGHGMRHPKLLDKQTGEVFEPEGEQRFPKLTRWLRESYARRIAERPPFDVIEQRPLQKPVLLNCLDAFYGHCLLKLLNAQYYLDHHPDLDLIVLVPSFLRWMVPEGVAAVWSVELPLRQGAAWYDGIAQEIAGRLQSCERCWLSKGFSHPHPEAYDIERFTGVAPFAFSDWAARLADPQITLIWREDRVWAEPGVLGLRQAVRHRLAKKLGQPPDVLELQRGAFTALADQLRDVMPALEITVAGLGQTGRFPPWIRDARVAVIDEATERAWCRQYARSHVVVGVHGSSMLLPSAHAGTVVDLMPPLRWRNMVQDVLIQERDARMATYRYRFIPLSSSVRDVSDLVLSILFDTGYAQLHFLPSENAHTSCATDESRPRRTDEVEYARMKRDGKHPPRDT